MIMVGTAYQSIGLGFPSRRRAPRSRSPTSTVVLTTGDGGGLMALADLESAVRVAGGRGLAVVWNDAAYGAEVNLYGLEGPRAGADAHPRGRLRRPRRGRSAPRASWCARPSDLEALADVGRAARATSGRSCCSTAASPAT